jgi:hypothetical protein
MSKPYNPNTQGWGFALVVCALTAGLAGTAYTIHKNTYRHPRDPMTTQVNAYADSTKAANKGKPAAEGEDHGGEH